MAVIDDTTLVDTERVIGGEAPESVARAVPRAPSAYSIAEVAERMELNPHTLRYYERVGLLEVERDSRGRRIYRDDDLGRIKFISCLRATGLPIRELQAYFAMVDAGTHTESDRLELLERHRENVLAQLADIQASLGVIEYKIELYGGAGAACSRAPVADPAEATTGAPATAAVP